MALRVANGRSVNCRPVRLVLTSARGRLHDFRARGDLDGFGSLADFELDVDRARNADNQCHILHGPRPEPFFGNGDLVVSGRQGRNCIFAFFVGSGANNLVGCQCRGFRPSPPVRRPRSDR